MQRIDLYFIVSCLFSLSLNSCSHSVLSIRDKKAELNQKAIFQYLQQPNILLNSLTGKGPIMIDPLLCLRETLTMNGKVYFDDSMHTENLKAPLPKKSYRLIIPDSLSNVYRYPDVGDQDYEHDYAIIHQFSPLLPTKEHNIYLMEWYFWGNNCDEKSCYRLLDRQYLSFKIENYKITILEGVLLSNVTDVVGFGSFARKKMDEALPGEKIIRYGH